MEGLRPGQAYSLVYYGCRCPKFTPIIERFGKVAELNIATAFLQWLLNSEGQDN